MELEFVVQNWHLFLALVVIVFLLAWDSSKNRLSGIKKVGATELPRVINHEDAVVVDVREPGEYRKGHIPGAVNLPLSQLKDSDGELEKYRKKKLPLVVACETGNRSHKAATLLKKAEIETVYNLSGGFSAWTKENLPVEK